MKRTSPHKNSDNIVSRKKQHVTSATFAYAFTLLTLGLPTAQAAPGTLAQQPLFLTNNVPPNVLFVNDNSFSMSWEILFPGGELGADGRLSENSDNLTPPLIHNTTCTLNSEIDTEEKIAEHYRARQYGRILQISSNECTQTVAEEEWRARTRAYNRLYFDPQRQYEPWPGYNNSSITQAPIDPTTFDWDSESPTAGSYVNLTSDSALLVNGNRSGYYATSEWTNWCASNQSTAGTCKGWRYYTWIDSDSEDDIDEGELSIHWIKDQDDATKQNFANWFTYHRKREYVAKYAIAKVISETNGMRMGTATINLPPEGPSGRVPIQPADSDKETLLDAVFKTDVTARTPLRSALENAGKYYKNGDFFGTAHDPILPDPAGQCQINNTILMTDGYYDGDEFDTPEFATLADAAEFYYQDLRSLEGEQRMHTYTVAFGVQGTLDHDTDVYADDFTWPDPTISDAAKIDDLWHAAVNGNGLFLSGDNSDELVESLRSALNDIDQQIESATSVTGSSFRLDDDSLIYVSRFNAADWTGELLAYSMDSSGNLTLTWSTDSTLANEDHSTREIITFDGADGVAFNWNDGSCSNCISSAMNEALSLTSDGTLDPDLGQARLDYLRGKPSDEFADVAFRPRAALLGDIVNSSAVYVGAPASFYPNSDPFGVEENRFFDFWDANKGRTPLLYVGANDGMLHALNANTGEEVFAYVPETLFADLPLLTDPAYNHRFYVDNTPSVSDVYTNDAWRTVLVGGLGAGGRGVYALDITDPLNQSATPVEAYAAQRVLWEFNHGDDEDLGYSFSRPVIALTKQGWAAIVGNGSNSSDAADDNGTASLFILYLDADLSDAGEWDPGTDYRKIDTGVGGVDAAENGLSSPTAVDTDADGYVDRVYAGDLHGNLWAFDLTDADDANWDVAYQESDGTPVPLFKAAAADDTPQPITAKPSVIRHPFQPRVSANGPNLMVYFGTGQYLTTDDLGDTATQSFYGVWDSGRIGSGDTPLSRAVLHQQSIMMRPGPG
jgi:type IV pilus assembly protein PilY1